MIACAISVSLLLILIGLLILRIITLESKIDLLEWNRRNTQALHEGEVSKLRAKHAELIQRLHQLLGELP